jgi:hypothetical protein
VLASNVTNNSYNAYLTLCLFGLALAELQLITSQSYNTSYLELAESYFELNWLTTPTELETYTETGF